jgi:hypothetical protein
VIKLTHILGRILLERKIQHLNELGFDQLETNYVGDGDNQVTSAVYEQIKKASNGKSAYATWLVLRVIDKSLKSEDVYKYENYFKIFDKYKAKYPIKDINQIKSKEQVAEFNRVSTDIADKLVATTGGQSDDKGKNLVPLKGIEELKEVGINMLGIVDGYQCFKIPIGLADNKEAWKVYRKWLAKCSGREDGEGIEICTMANHDYFQEYLYEDDLYVFFNMSDPRSPYQLHYQSEQFMDKNDRSII